MRFSREPVRSTFVSVAINGAVLDSRFRMYRWLITNNDGLKHPKDKTERAETERKEKNTNLYSSPVWRAVRYIEFRPVDRAENFSIDRINPRELGQRSEAIRYIELCRFLCSVKLVRSMYRMLRAKDLHQGKGSQERKQRRNGREDRANAELFTGTEQREGGKRK